MNLSRTSAIVIRHFYLVSGSPARVLPLFAWVAIDMVLWGFITKYLNSVSAAGFDFVPVFLGAVLLWDFFTRVMHGVTMAFMEDVWSRNFLNIFATPLLTSEYVGGLVLSSIGTSAVGLLVMIVLASTIFGLSFIAYGVALIPFLLVLFLFGIALGIIGAAIVLRFGPHPNGSSGRSRLWSHRLQECSIHHDTSTLDAVYLSGVAALVRF